METIQFSAVYSPCLWTSEYSQHERIGLLYISFQIPSLSKFPLENGDLVFEIKSTYVITLLPAWPIRKSQQYKYYRDCCVWLGDVHPISGNNMHLICASHMSLIYSTTTCLHKGLPIPLIIVRDMYIISDTWPWYTVKPHAPIKFLKHNYLPHTCYE